MHNPERTSRRPGAGRAAILMLAAWIAGCEAPPPGELTPLPEISTVPADDATPGSVQATAALRPANDSGVRGEVMAMHTVDAVVIVIEMEGLAAAGEYAAHIHRGRCAEGGPVAIALDPVIGLDDRTGTSTTTIERDELATGEPLFVQVHGAGSAPLACGDVQGQGP